VVFSWEALRHHRVIIVGYKQAQLVLGYTD
jgi:hypothetical protein